MLWQQGNLGLYSSSLTIGARSGHICVNLRTDPEGTPAPSNTPLTPCGKKMEVQEQGGRCRGWSWTMKRVEPQSLSRVVITLLHSQDASQGRWNVWKTWLFIFVDYMAALECCLENLVQNPRYSFVSPFLYVLYFNHCHTFFLFKVILYIYRETLFCDAYHVSRWNCSFDDGCCQGNGSNSLVALGQRRSVSFLFH